MACAKKHLDLKDFHSFICKIYGQNLNILHLSYITSSFVNIDETVTLFFLNANFFFK